MKPTMLLLLLLTVACGATQPLPLPGPGPGDDGGGPPPPPTCAPGEVFCDGALIRRCADDGVPAHADVEAMCSDDPVRRRCGACNGAAACVSPTPLCDGTLSGPGGAPSTFTNSGCGAAPPCEMHTEGSVVRMTAEVGGETWTILIQTALVPSEGTVALNGNNAATVSVVQVNGEHCHSVSTPGDFFPSAGYMRATYRTLQAGDPFEVEVSGPLACGVAPRWMSVTGHVTGTIAAVR